MAEQNPYTVVGRYPGGKAVVVHVQCEHSWDARRRAVQRIAFDVYDKTIPEGLGPINEAIAAVGDDFDLVVVLDGHANPCPDHRAGGFIFHGTDSESVDVEDTAEEKG